MEELNFRTLNQQITRMRKYIAKYKVHLVRKLTRKSHQLKARKGPETVVQKYSKKADSLIAELLAGKVDESPEVKFQSRLGGYDEIKKEIDKFHDEHPSWQKLLPQLFSKTTKDKKIKAKKKNNSKNIEMLQNKSFGTLKETEKPKTVLEDTFNKWTVSNIENVAEVEETEDVIDVNVDDAEESSSDDFDGGGDLGSSESESTEEDEVPPIKKSIAITHPKLQHKEKKPDSFFMTLDDKDYLTECHVEETPVQQKSKEFKEDSAIDFFSKKNDELVGNDFPAHFRQNKRLNLAESRRRQPRSEKKKPLKKPVKSKPFKKINPPPPVKLHPSWEAKKKQSVNIVSFQGNKIVFD